VAAPEKAVHERKDVQAAVYQGKTYFLGDADDVKVFKANPDKYTKAVADEMKTRRDDSEHWFTCGMHPDALQKGPGKCSICEMKLIPVKGTNVKSEHAYH
jgi:Cu+-exporting ATPase